VSLTTPAMPLVVCWAATANGNSNAHTVTKTDLKRSVGEKTPGGGLSGIAYLLGE